jgi:hypothetical protein
MSKIRTHYNNLKISRDAPDIVIKAAHKALLQKHHPDKATDKDSAERITRILNDARDVLLDPVRRRQHDDWISEQETKCQQKPAYSAPTKEAEADKGETQIGRFLCSNTGTATDRQNRLMWCRFALGQIWQDQSVSGDATLFTWADALTAAKAFNAQGGFAGHDDWRLPEISELKTLLERPQGEMKGPVFNHEAFIKSPFMVWSSTPYAGYGGGAWFVNFSEGIAINESPNFHRAVRLVRACG